MVGDVRAGVGVVGDVRAGVGVVGDVRAEVGVVGDVIILFTPRQVVKCITYNT